MIPWISEHATQLKNWFMVGADGRTPTERVERQRSSATSVRSWARKVCSCRLLLPDEETLAQASTTGSTKGAGHLTAGICRTPSGGIRCRTVRQLSADERDGTGNLRRKSKVPRCLLTVNALETSTSEWTSLRHEATEERTHGI